MYILGAVEIMINYIKPEMSIGTAEDNARMYGTCFLIGNDDKVFWKANIQFGYQN